MSKKISGAEYPIAKIFSSEFQYEVPAYQRPYALTDDETLELFDDLYEFHRTEAEDDYFLGSIVLIKQATKPQAPSPSRRCVPFSSWMVGQTKRGQV